jgi:hypothetical protein
MLKTKSIAALFLTLAVFGCADSFEHDTGLASKRAIEFAEVTFVRANLEQGYGLLADKARSYIPMNIFTDKINKMQPSGRPSKIVAVSANAVKGEKIVQVVLRGEGADGRFEYSISLTGTASADYRVTTFGGGRSS